VDGKEWAERDNKTMKVKWRLTETARTDDYLELFNEARKETWRLSAKRMEIKAGDKWNWLSNGQWGK
jgi:hypothetical protein